MKDKCYVDISVKMSKENRTLKIDESTNDFQITIELGSLEKIQIHDENVLYLQYSTGSIRLDLDYEAFYAFILTELKCKSGIKNEP